MLVSESEVAHRSGGAGTVEMPPVAGSEQVPELARFGAVKGWRLSDQIGFQMGEFLFVPSIA